jgi:membrane fusion protein, heavy metal efflux system
MRKKISLVALMVGVCACSMAAYFLTKSPAQEPPENEPEHARTEFLPFSQEQLAEHQIELQPAAAGTLKQIVRAPAKISICSDKLVHIIPKTSGTAIYSAEHPYKNLGEKIAAGEVLAYLESKEAAEVKSEYLKALTQIKLAANRFTREQTLHQQQISSAEEFYQAEHDLEEARIDTSMALQKLYALGINQQEIDRLPDADPQELRFYAISSPLSGQIVNRHIAPGELIDPTHEIYTVADLSSVWAEINLFSKDRPLVKAGQAVQLTSPDGHRSAARIVYLSPVLSEETGQSQAIAEVDNRSGIWLPGSFVFAELVAVEEPALLLVPRSAVHELDGEKAVFVERPDGFAVKVIRLGRSDESCCEILSGIEAGERVAATNSFLLKADLKKEEAEHAD